MGAARVRRGAAALAALCACASAACILPSYEEQPAPAPGSPLAPLWSRRLGGLMDDDGLDVALDAAGNVIVAGRFQSRMSFDGEATFVGPALSGDGFVAKYNDAGQSLFTVTLGDDVAAQEANSVVVDPASQDVVFGGAFQGLVELDGQPPLAGGAAGAALVTRLDAGGNVLWARAFHDGADYWNVTSRGVAVDSQGDVVVAGRWCGGVDFAAGDTMPIPGVGVLSDTSNLNGFVTKRDGQTGDLQWVVRIDSNGATAIVRGIAVDASDNVIFTGYFEQGGTITDTTGMQFALGPTAVGRDLFVVELDSDGNYLWSITLDEEGTQEGTAVALDPAGNALVSGFSVLGVEGEITPPGFHAIALKIDRTGYVEWKTGLPALDLDAAFDVAADAAGDVLLTGRRTSFVRSRLQRPDDVLLAVLNGADGTVKTMTTYGNDGSQYGGGLVVDAEGNVIIAGAFQEEIDFGGGALESKGGTDIFLTKLHHP